MTGATRNSNPSGEWRAGWPLVATSCIGMMVSVLHIYSMGVFMEPIQASTGWERTEITVALTITSSTTVLFATIVGWMIDKYGARRVGIPGTALYCAAFAALAFVPDSVWIWWAMWVLVAAGALFIKPTLWTAAVATRFVKARGLAFALTLCGTGLAAATMPIAAHHAIAAFGWRGAFGVLGATAGILLIPAMLLWFREGGGAPGAAPRKIPPAPGTVRRLVMSRRFLQLAIATFLVTAAITVLVIHFVPILRSRGLSPGLAASVAGIIGLCSIAGRIAGGALLDRVNGRWIAGIAFTLPCVACLLLLLGPMSTPVAIAAAVFIGVSLGAEIEVVAYLTSRYFGLRSYGLIFGTIVAFLSLGSGLGPLAASAVFDATGSYQSAILAVIPLFAGAALLVTTLGRYPDNPDAAYD